MAGWCHRGNGEKGLGAEDSQDQILHCINPYIYIYVYIIPPGVPDVYLIQLSLFFFTGSLILTFEAVTFL
jgi:hypothetical protein